MHQVLKADKAKADKARRPARWAWVLLCGAALFGLAAAHEAQAAAAAAAATAAAAAAA